MAVRTDLRYARWWLILGWVAVAGAWVLNLMPARALHAVHINDKLEHMFGYLLLTLWFGGVYPRAAYWRVALGFAAMGALVEVLQGAMHWGRTEDIHDFYADCAGIALGLLLALLGARRWPDWIERRLPRL